MNSGTLRYPPSGRTFLCMYIPPNKIKIFLGNPYFSLHLLGSWKWLQLRTWFSAYIANLRPPSAHRVRAIHHDPLFKGLTQPHSSRSLGRLLLEPKFKSNWLYDATSELLATTLHFQLASFVVLITFCSRIICCLHSISISFHVVEPWKYTIYTENNVMFWYKNHQQRRE